MTVSFDKARDKWRYNFRINGQRYLRDCIDPTTGEEAKTKRDAKAIESRIRSRILEGATRPLPTAQDYTLAQAVVVYLEKGSAGAEKVSVNHRRSQKIYARELLAFFGPETLVSDLGDVEIERYTVWSEKQHVRRWIGGGKKKSRSYPTKVWKTTKRLRSPGTINRYLDALRRVLRLAHEARDPQSGERMLKVLPNVPAVEEIERLPRPIAPDDLAAIVAVSPPHLADAIRLTVLMGFRKTEVFMLEEDQVDESARGVWLDGENTKGKRDEFVPASQSAMAILIRLKRRARELGQKRLILYRNKPVKSANRAWRTAMKKTGLAGKHVFHNTKASFVTAVATTMPGAVVQDLARHRTFATTMRYIKVADANRRDAMEAAATNIGHGIGFSATTSINLENSPSYTSELHIADSVLSDASPNPLKDMVGTAGFEPATTCPPDKPSKPKPL
ncbi:tyrosine-type recombinase/integrase [Bradyrhizobium niftali]|uniref:tyrosine-type recombinase/integrase n=1 Tax=Bradyrhizobium niftali TaxID=2560055 RepID=UPI001431EFBE|nr:tyrosine-type recombinase/integrase [Bradyrhizobium niftali]